MLDERDAHLRSQVRHALPATKDDAFRAAAFHNAPPAFAEAARKPATSPGPPIALSAVREDQTVAHIRRYHGTSRRIVSAIHSWSPAQSLAASDDRLSADAQGGRADRRDRHLPPGGAAVHRQADRAGAELRRPGRHRHREHAAAQRAAPAHRRSLRIAGAADRDLRGAEGHLQLAGRAGAGVPGHAGERDAHLRGQVRQPVVCAKAMRSAPSRCTARRRPMPRCAQREPVFRPGPKRPLGRVVSDQAGRPYRRPRSEPGYIERDPLPVAARRARRRADRACRADAQGRRADRRHRHLPPGGAAVHRQADRAGAELRRAGRHRHREHAAAQRAAPAHRRSQRVAGAADGDLGGAAGHLQLARRAGAGVRGHAGERDAHLRGQVRHPASLYDGRRVPRGRRCTTRRRHLPNACGSVAVSAAPPAAALGIAACRRSRLSTSPT